MLLLQHRNYLRLLVYTEQRIRIPPGRELSEPSHMPVLLAVRFRLASLREEFCRVPPGRAYR